MRKKPSELDFDEYIRQVEPTKREKSYAWSTAIGLQQVDGLTPSDYPPFVVLCFASVADSRFWRR